MSEWIERHHNLWDLRMDDLSLNTVMEALNMVVSLILLQQIIAWFSDDECLFCAYVVSF